MAVGISKINYHNSKHNLFYALGLIILLIKLDAEYW